MTFDVVASERFRSDVLAAIDYLADAGCSPDVIDTFRNQIGKSVSLLGEFPHINQVSNKPGLASRNYREHFIGKYDIVYVVEGNTVYLVRFLHQMQDIETKV